MQEGFSSHSLLNGNKAAAFITALMLRKDFDFQAYDYNHANLCYLALSELQKYYGAFVADTEKLKIARISVEQEETDGIFAETTVGEETQQAEISHSDGTDEQANGIPQNWIRVTLGNFMQLVGTVPAECKIGEHRLFGNKWADILTEIAELEKDNPALQRLYYESISGKTTGNPFFLKEKAENMRYKQLLNSYWVNINHSIPSIIQQIYKLCELCGYGKDEIVLYGASKTSVSANKQAHLEESAEIKPDYNVGVQEINLDATQNYLKATIPESYSNEHRAAEAIISLPEGNEQVEQILLEKFSNGLDMSINLDLRKFKHCFAEMFGKEYNGDDRALREDIAKLCIIDGSVARVLSSLITVSLAEDVVSYLGRQFAKGEDCVHYDALYNTFKDRIFEDGLKINSGNMLRQCLQIVARGYFCYYINFIAPKSGYNASNNIHDKIVDCIRDYGFPVSFEELCQKLPNISKKEIKKVTNSNEFVNNGGGFFYYDMFSLSEEDKKCVENIIEQLLSVKTSISGDELLVAINENHPNIIADNNIFSQLGQRNALKYYFEQKYSFKGNVISKYSVSASAADKFAEFCKENLPFNIDALKAFAESLGSAVYYDTVYDNSLRISQREFVPKAEAQFDVDATDSAIEGYMQGRQYMPLSEIKHFAAFPYAGYAWNEFLLEHFVYAYSNRFKLVHPCFTQKATSGAIVRKNAEINSFDDLVANALADSDVALNKEEAMAYLKDKGYKLTQKYSNIDAVLIKAHELRNKRRVN